MIDIQDIIPFMKDGWVAMDKSGKWFWYDDNEPEINYDFEEWDNQNDCEGIGGFDIAPADDWTKSLIKVGGK